MAQEVEEVFPTWVTEHEPFKGDEEFIPKGEKSKALSFPHDFNAYIVKAIKELVEWIRESDSEKDRRIRALEEENKALKAWACSIDPGAPFCQ